MDTNAVRRSIYGDLVRIRAERFMGNSAIRTRLPEYYQESPDLLAADVAWSIMEALCAAELAGVPVDLDAAVSSGRDLFEEFMQHARAQD